jgi:hypothetical protein
MARHTRIRWHHHLALLVDAATQQSGGDVNASAEGAKYDSQGQARSASPLVIDPSEGEA